MAKGKGAGSKVVIQGESSDASGDFEPQLMTDGAGHTFGSATSSGAVTASDSTVLDYNAIYVGGTGNVSVDHTEGGTAVVYTNVQAGTILPVAGVRINAATSATSMTWMKW